RHPLEKEGAPLLEEGLERGEVELRRIRFDLAEVGIDRAVEGEVRGQSVLEIRAHRALLRAMDVVATHCAGIPHEHVRRDLEPTRRAESGETADVAELGDEGIAR